MTKNDSVPFKVMLVEDDAGFRRILAETLRSKFPTIVLDEAVNGTEALEKVENFMPQLVIMDIQLPGQNGLEITREIKTLYPDINVIIITSLDYPEYREAARVSGASHFFSKGSVTSQEIEDVVEGLWTIWKASKIYNPNASSLPPDVGQWCL